MGSEAEHFSAGNKRLIIPYRGWNICLLVCYDLRFPVWSRNVNNEYDLLIYVANWPIPRRLVWDTLLRARALENQCYVCGVNRVGIDGYQLTYNGGSRVYSAFGEEIGSLPDEQEGIATTSLQLVLSTGSGRSFRYGKMQTNSICNIGNITNVKNRFLLQQYLELSS